MLCTFPYGASLSRQTCPNIYGIVAPFYSSRRLSPKRTPQSGRGPFWLCMHFLCAPCITRWALSSQGAAICETLITADEYCTWTCPIQADSKIATLRPNNDAIMRFFGIFSLYARARHSPFYAAGQHATCLQEKACIYTSIYTKIRSNVTCRCLLTIEIFTRFYVIPA
jgi:hypothetical protein